MAFVTPRAVQPKKEALADLFIIYSVITIKSYRGTGRQSLKEIETIIFISTHLLITTARAVLQHHAVVVCYSNYASRPTSHPRCGYKKIKGLRV